MKTFTAIIGLLVVLFAATSCTEQDSAQKRAGGVVTGKTGAEKERIQNFWQLYRQATKLRLTGELTEAAAVYEQAIKLEPGHENALYYFGNICFELGHFKKAEDAYLQLLKINPSSARAHMQLGHLYLRYNNPELFDVDKAGAAYAAAARLNGEVIGPILRLGQIAILKGDTARARAYFEDVIGTNFKSVEANLLLGYLAWKRRHKADAKTRFQQAVTYSRRHEPVHGVAGEGDTRPETRKTLEESARHATLFYSFLQELAALDAKATRAQMQALYLRLDRHIQRIREKIR